MVSPHPPPGRASGAPTCFVHKSPHDEIAYRAAGRSPPRRIPVSPPSSTFSVFKPFRNDARSFLSPLTPAMLSGGRLLEGELGELSGAARENVKVRRLPPMAEVVSERQRQFNVANFVAPNGALMVDRRTGAGDRQAESARPADGQSDHRRAGRPGRGARGRCAGRERGDQRRHAVPQRRGERRVLRVQKAWDGSVARAGPVK